MQQSNPSPVQHATGILDTEDDMDDPVFDELLANIGSSLAEHTAVVLPDTFDLEEQINELSYTCLVTEQQSMVNEIFASFMDNEQIVRSFLNQQYDRCMKFYAQTVIPEPGRESPVPQCQLTAFYKLWQSHMTSAEYEMSCKKKFLKTQTAVKKTKRAASQEKTDKPPENDDGDEEREEEEEESCYKCGKLLKAKNAMLKHCQNDDTALNQSH
ncbi:hypothetical protein DPMN_137288 [Dreissena polymorpha]|uniref:Uncharacterized protein n=1 Tax=Dreissena polymorpha TaxID=45954 RepID=A0A9D4JDH5_DREPO|nr:hypothetical protein DPMN_137288 [Dreissena polymorpha]